MNRPADLPGSPSWLGCPGALGCRPLLRRLRGTTHRPPSDGPPVVAGQVRRIGVGARRRSRLQATELDEPAVPVDRRGRRLDRGEQRRRTPGDHRRRGHARLPARSRGRSGPGQGRRGGPPAGAAGRAGRAAGTGLHADPAGVSDADRAGRPALPGPGGRGGGGGDQAPGRDRRRRAVDPLPRPTGSRSVARPGGRGVRRAADPPQARTLAEDRGIRCVVLDYDEMRGLDDPSGRLF